MNRIKKLLIFVATLSLFIGTAAIGEDDSKLLAEGLAGKALGDLMSSLESNVKAVEEEAKKAKARAKYLEDQIAAMTEKMSEAMARDKEKYEEGMEAEKLAFEEKLKEMAESQKITTQESKEKIDKLNGKLAVLEKDAKNLTENTSKGSVQKFGDELKDVVKQATDVYLSTKDLLWAAMESCSWNDKKIVLEVAASKDPRFSQVPSCVQGLGDSVEELFVEYVAVLNYSMDVSSYADSIRDVALASGNPFVAVVFVALELVFEILSLIFGGGDGDGDGESGPGPGQPPSPDTGTNPISAPSPPGPTPPGPTPPGPTPPGPTPPIQGLPGIQAEDGFGCIMRKGGSDLSIIFIAQDNPANSFSIDFAEMGDEFSDPKKYKFFQCNFDDKSVGVQYLDSGDCGFIGINEQDSRYIFRTDLLENCK